jgi:hypothetical protein
MSVIVKHSLSGLLAMLSLAWLSLLLFLEPDDWYAGGLPNFILAGCIFFAALLAIKRGTVGGTLIIVCGVLFGLSLVYQAWFYGISTSDWWEDLLIGLTISTIGAAIRWLDQRRAAS